MLCRVVRSNNVQRRRRQAYVLKRPIFLVFRHMSSASRTVPRLRRRVGRACMQQHGGRIMNSNWKLALAVVAGAAFGASAMQGLHAQGKPKAYQVTELEILDADAWKTFVQAVRASQQAASGRNLRTAGGKVVAFVGD